MNDEPGANLYLLDDDHKPYRCPDVLEWGRAFEEGWRRKDAGDVPKWQVCYTPLGDDGELGGVSTVFLGIDHNFWGGPPILFETMIFCDRIDEMSRQMERTSSWDAALAAHDRMVMEARELLQLADAVDDVLGD